MLKYSSGKQYFAVPASQLGAQEHVIASFSIPNVAPTDQVIVEMELTWRKSPDADLGFMELQLHQDTPCGPVVYNADEVCYSATTTFLEFEATGVSMTDPSYVLTIASHSYTAIFTGPLFITCRVYADEG